MSNPQKSLAERFDDLEIKFVASTPRKPMVKFEDMDNFFTPIEPNDLVPGNNYLVFSKSPLGKEGDSYNIVKYVSSLPNGDIYVSEMFMRIRRTYGWSNTEKLMKGSRFYKDPKTYEKNEIYSELTYKNLTEREKRRIEYFFKDLGPRGNEITVDTDENIIDDIIKDIMNSDQKEEEGHKGGKFKKMKKNKKTNRKTNKKGRKYKKKITKKRR